MPRASLRSVLIDIADSAAFTCLVSSKLRLIRQFGDVFGRIQDRNGCRDLVDRLQDLRKCSPWSGLPPTNLIVEPSDQPLPAQEFGVVPNARDHLIPHFLNASKTEPSASRKKAYVGLDNQGALNVSSIESRYGSLRRLYHVRMAKKPGEREVL
jgi:hypothetical protein